MSLSSPYGQNGSQSPLGGPAMFGTQNWGNWQPQGGALSSAPQSQATSFPASAPLSQLSATLSEPPPVQTTNPLSTTLSEPPPAQTLPPTPLAMTLSEPPSAQAPGPTLPTTATQPPGQLYSSLSEPPPVTTAPTQAPGQLFSSLSEPPPAQAQNPTNMMINALANPVGAAPAPMFTAPGGGFSPHG